MDPASFLKHSRISGVFAEEFAKELARSPTSWKTKNLDLVMDIGCGPGNILTYWIDYYFPDIKRLIGIDVDPGMIALAKEQNKKEKIEYYVADIMDKQSLKEWEGSVNWIFCHFVLHRVNDQKQAFRNVFDLLRPSSEAALRFIVESPFHFAFRDLLQTSKWRQILEPTNFLLPEGLVKKYDAAHYKEMFEDVGFRVQQCVIKPMAFPFQSDDECIGFLLSLHSIGEVSEEVRQEYKKDLFYQYMKYSHRDTEGRSVNDLIVLQAKLYKD